MGFISQETLDILRTAPEANVEQQILLIGASLGLDCFLYLLVRLLIGLQDTAAAALA
jgi:hypothetical protein